MNFSELFHFHHIFVRGGGHLSEITTQKSEKKVDIWAKEKQPKRVKSKKPDGHLSERKIIQKSEI
jgi:hypothetical protein